MERTVPFVVLLERPVFPFKRKALQVSGWVVNGTHFFGSFHWKISGRNGISEKVVLQLFTIYKKFPEISVGK